MENEHKETTFLDIMKMLRIANLLTESQASEILKQMDVVDKLINTLHSDKESSKDVELNLREEWCKLVNMLHKIGHSM